jgi:putative addiction module component (TIGR02574 family)
VNGKETTMTDQVAELIERGRALRPEDRERLVADLLASLNEPAASALDAAWEHEIELRLAAYDRGEVTAIDAEEVFAKARHIAR